MRHASSSIIADDPGPVDLPFSAHVVFPGDHDLRSAVFSPDGSSLYAHVAVPAIDVWQVSVSFWPEILAGVLALLTLFVLWRWRAIVARKRVRGKSYCRACNYEVGDAPSNVASTVSDAAAPQDSAPPTASPSIRKCPECGSPLLPHMILPGRSTLRRLRWVLAIWLLAAAGYATLFIVKVPREGEVSQWTSLCSKDLADWATLKKIAWLIPRIKRCDRVIELDPATGAIRRVVTTLPSQTWVNISISPDGQLLFLDGGQFQSIACVSITSGRVRRVARLPGEPVTMQKDPAVIGFSPEGATAYIQWHNREQGMSGVSAWNTATGKLTEALRVPAYEDDRTARTTWPRHFQVRFDHRGSPIFLSYPDFMEAYPSGKFIVRLHESDLAPREFSLTPSPESITDPAWRFDEQQLIAVSKYGRALAGWSLADGTHLGDEIFNHQQGGGGRIAHDASVRFLATGFSKVISVRDAVATRWLARLQCPPSGYGAQIIMTPDASWCAAVFQVNAGKGGAGGGVSFELVTWHLDAARRAREYDESLKSK